MATGLAWVVTPETAWLSNYERWAMGLYLVVESVLAGRADEIRVWMQSNHVWQNRTHIAEEGLFTEIVRDGTFISLVMGHGDITYYSRFLERYMSPVRPGVSKWSVLAPALDYWGPILLNDVRRALGS